MAYEEVFEMVFRLRPQGKSILMDLGIPVLMGLVGAEWFIRTLKHVFWFKGLRHSLGVQIGLRIGIIYIFVWSFHFILSYWHLLTLLIVAVIGVIILTMKEGE